MSFFDFLFPKKCLGCGKRGNYFCYSCQSKIEPLEPQVYPPKYPFDGLFCIFPYLGIIRKAILKLKYSFVSELSDELVDLAFFRLKVENPRHFVSGRLTLVPVPLHWYRKNWRGFNHTEILGEKLSQRLKIDFCPDLLLRTRSTKPQVKFKGKDAKKKRKENVRGAFKINPNILISQYLNILLFDDVWTTGATMKECGRVLKNAGVKKVFGFTLARKVPPLAEQRA